MRDRLIELIRQAKKQTKNANCDIERNMIFADYLLENGVIVPPCKVGDKIYRAVYDWGGCKTVSEWELVKLEVYVEEVGFVDDSDNWIAVDDIGKTIFLTREEAEAKLKGGEG